MVSNIVTRSGTAFAAVWLILLWVTGARASGAGGRRGRRRSGPRRRLRSCVRRPRSRIASATTLLFWFALQATLGQRGGRTQRGGHDSRRAAARAHYAQSAGAEARPPRPAAARELTRSRDPRRDQARPARSQDRARESRRPVAGIFPSRSSSPRPSRAARSVRRCGALISRIRKARLDALVARGPSARGPAAGAPAARVKGDGWSTKHRDQAPKLSTIPTTPRPRAERRLWLEARRDMAARSTWSSGKEEVAVERMRAERVEAQERLAMRVLDLLFACAEEQARSRKNGLASPEEHPGCASSRSWRRRRRSTFSPMDGSSNT